MERLQSLSIRFAALFAIVAYPFFLQAFHKTVRSEPAALSPLSIIAASVWLGAGAPTGLIHDPWNIRLVPRYWLGVFFVLAHMATGLRVIVQAHGVNEAIATRLWIVGLAASAMIATAILAGMCGLRV